MWIKRLIVVVLLLIVTSLVACGTAQTIEEVENENVRFAGLEGSVTIVTDNETKCKYLRETSGHAIALSPLLKSDGTADCGEIEEQQELTFTLTISEFGKQTVHNKIAFEEGQNVLEVLKENFEIVEKDTFVTGIDGVIANESKQEFWSFIVNGEQAMVGSAEYEITNGDEITFDLTNW